ncbi:hypothetical protein [[Limnothrix rosea] IAM M-220]|uniref:hypothetical protein n=1 Tax=[Limnothrix rosea] IAM M-220 TaxID=454133 RepID=UPI0009660D4D|nr:hypothetical protein [[Limnothrix rosea] IAM M-220]OKH14658.1 hypothetical protein NIES208_13455 [[Limnothrix rosea] IAM M-220]
MVKFNKLEKKGIDKGVRRALLNQIRHGLDIKFPKDATILFTEIQRVASLHALQTVEASIYNAKTPAALRSIYQNYL